ncbi:MAG: oligopeptide transporter, OPT family [bacterium]|nr:oligopeptide transporter, OPT family [bacterium]
MTTNTGCPRELSVRAVVLSVVLAIVLGSANAYLGLFAGMTVCASIPAAVIAMACFRLWGGAATRECNIVQTAASAGEALAAGVIFTLPALVLMGVWARFPWWQVTLIAMTGGVLGTLFTVPLRRALLPRADLRFPEGVAIADVLRLGQQTGEHGAAQGAWVLCLSAVAGAALKIAQQALGVWPAALEGATRVRGAVLAGGVDLSPALLGVGYIAGVRVALLVFAGGALAWLCAVPAATLAGGDSSADAMTAAYAAWRSSVRYLGVGAMIVGGLQSVVHLLQPLWAMLRAEWTHLHDKNTKDVRAATDKDIPMAIVLGSVGVLIIPAGAIVAGLLDGWLAISIVTLLSIILGFLFAAVAAYMAGMVGSSNNPISGITLAAMLLVALVLLFLVGAGNSAAPACAVLVGAITCCAAAIAGDVMQDLKTGQLVGATPWKQELMEIVGVIAAAMVMSFVLNVLHDAYGIGSATLSAPQATLIKTVAEGVFRGGLPWGWIGAGAGFALVIIGMDEWLRWRRGVRVPVLAIAVGMYLPFTLSVAMLLGGLIAWQARRGRRVATARDLGVLGASGFITGEALMGIVVALPIFLSGNRAWWPHLTERPWLGALAFVLCAAGLWASARGSLLRQCRL